MYDERGETEGLLTRTDPLGGNPWLVHSGVVLDPGMTTVDARGTVPGGGAGRSRWKGCQRRAMLTPVVP
jgi:hypothetical protein